MKRLMIVVLLVSGFLPFHVLAQVGPADSVRVRIRTTADSSFIGNLSNVSDEELSLLLEGEEAVQVTLLHSEIVSIDQSRGLRRSFNTGFVAGFLGTTALTAIFAAANWSPCTETNNLANQTDSIFGECFMHPESRGDALLLGLAGGAVLGLFTGVAVGLSMPKQERWTPLALPEPNSVRLSIRPAARFDRGLSLGIAISASIGR